MEKFNSLIRKVPIKQLLLILEDVFAQGAEFVDIYGKTNEGKDSDEITIAVPHNYLNDHVRPEYNDEIKLLNDSYPDADNLDDWNEEEKDSESDIDDLINDL